MLDRRETEHPEKGVAVGLIVAFRRREGEKGVARLTRLAGDLYQEGAADSAPPVDPSDGKRVHPRLGAGMIRPSLIAAEVGVDEELDGPDDNPIFLSDNHAQPLRVIGSRRRQIGVVQKRMYRRVVGRGDIAAGRRTVGVVVGGAVARRESMPVEVLFTGME